ncbi:MAG TPA: hypothetical protein PLQ55_01460 [Bacilli bacterium]|nr:MAG: hypothetical protein EWM49_00370 [Bacillota bacterium]HOQ70189.1 hypothetical protein [Bacilli bacterium]HPK28639.1 hypothetical protein [Bacilli bacterium]
MIKTKRDLEVIKKRMQPDFHLRKEEHKYRLLFRYNEKTVIQNIEKIIDLCLAAIYQDKLDAVAIKVYDTRVEDKLILVVKEKNRAVRYNIKNEAMVTEILNKHIGQGKVVYEYVDVIDKEA